MPEAAVQEDRHLRPREDKVSLAAKALERLPVHEVAKPQTMNVAPKLQLRSRITARLSAHLVMYGVA